MTDAALPRSRTRRSYADITLYAPDRRPCAVDLSDNTNLWGAPPGASRALAGSASHEAGSHEGASHGAASGLVTRYPSLYAPGLKERLAAYLGVDAAMVVTGCGSDDVLDSAIRAVTEPGDRVAVPEPSFAMIPIFARMNGLAPVMVPLRGGTELDADAMLATGARVIYLCSPNNPTGNLLDARAVERVVREAPGVVIIDEAYAEYAGEDALALLGASDRLLVCRTMSKAFGLAGLRVGYAVGAPELVAEVEKSRGPYKVSTLAERAAAAALDHDLAWVRERIAEAVANRERLRERLRARGLAPLASRSNFLLVPVPDATATAARMRALGVAVRPFAALPAIGDAIRVSVGPWEMMEQFLAALDEAMADVTAGRDAGGS